MNATLSLGQLYTLSTEAISSKSYVHRLLIAAALSKREGVEVKTNIVSKDMEATVECLNALGASIKIKENAFLVEKGISFVDKAVLDCKESGSTARFLLPLATFLCKEVTLTGEGKLPQRPFEPLNNTLREKGINISSDYLPLKACGDLKSGVYSIPGDVSSQFISGLLFVLPLLEGDSRIELTTALESKGYVDMTMDVLSGFGINIIPSEFGYTIPGGQVYHCPERIEAEGDWSNSGYLLCMCALGRGVTLTGLRADSMQQDKEVIKILQSFGAEVIVNEDEVTLKASKYKGIDVDATNIPDLIPALCVVAAYADGVSTFHNVGRLRIKESDRIKAIEHIMEQIGVKTKVSENGEVTDLLIFGKGGGQMRGEFFTSADEICFDGFGDHRIVMAEAATVLREKSLIRIKGAEAVNKSFPGFFEVISKMGICVTEE